MTKYGISSSSGVSSFILGFCFSISIKNQLIVLLKSGAILIWNFWNETFGNGCDFSLEEGPATHSSILAWRIPWTEEAGGLQSIGSQRVRHDWSDSHTHTCDFSTNFSSLHLVTRPHVRYRRKSESSRKGREQQLYCLRSKFLHCFLVYAHFTSKGTDCLCLDFLSFKRVCVANNIGALK